MNPNAEQATLSVRGAAAVVERRIRTYGATAATELERELDRYGVEPERAERAIALACVRGKVVRRTIAGETHLVAPSAWRSA